MTARFPPGEPHPPPSGAREQPRQVDEHSLLFELVVVPAHRAEEFLAGRCARLRIPLDHQHHPHVMSPSSPSQPRTASPSVIPDPLGTYYADESSPAGSCLTQSLPGPHWGREPAKISGQQRTTTDNNTPGQPACWLAARPLGPRLQRRGHRFEPCHAHPATLQVNVPSRHPAPGTAPIPATS
jgi:hypothetical protein